MKTPQVAALPGMTPLGIKPKVVITDETKLHVCIQRRVSGETVWNEPEFFFTAKFKFLSHLLNFRHKDAAQRIKRELEGGEILSMAYDRDVAYAIGLEP